MNALLASIGQCAVETATGIEARPRTSREVVDVLNALRDAKERLGETVKLSRAALQSVSSSTPESSCISVGAGVSLSALETDLNSKGLSLGVLPGHAPGLTLASFLEGELAGHRLIRGGLTESICTRVEMVTADGRLFTAGALARESAGPNLMSLALGGGGRLALVTRAEVQCVPVAELQASMVFELGDASAAIEALRDSLDDEAFVTAAQLSTGNGETRILKINIQGSRSALARDRSAVYAAVRRQKGVETKTTMPRVAEHGRLMSWSTLLTAARELKTEDSLLIERPARNAVVASCTKSFSLKKLAATQFGEGLTHTFDPQDIMARPR